MSRQAEIRNSHAAHLLEGWLDANADRLDDDIFDELDNLAGDMDDHAEETKGTMQDLIADIERLQESL